MGRKPTGSQPAWRRCSCSVGQKMQKLVEHLGKFYGENGKAWRNSVEQIRHFCNAGFSSPWSMVSTAALPCQTTPAKESQIPSFLDPIDRFLILPQTLHCLHWPIRTQHSKETGGHFSYTFRSTDPLDWTKGCCNGPARIGSQLCASHNNSRMVLGWLDFQIRLGSSCTTASTRLKTG